MGGAPLRLPSRAGSRPLYYLFTRLEGWLNPGPGGRLNPLYHTGAIATWLFGLCVLTGIYLFLVYRVGPEEAYRSVAALDQDLFGRTMRSLHHYAADGAFVFSLLHLLRYLASGRFRGNAWLSWVTGTLALGVFLLVGLTGYLMPWDVLSQVLLREVARVADTLPLFAEPLSRSLLLTARVSPWLFFMALAAHIMTTVGAGLLVGTHLLRIARPRLWPSWQLAAGTGLALLLLSLLFPILSQPQANLEKIPAEVRVDHFYLFYLPLIKRWGSFGALGGLLAASGVLALLPFLLPGRRLPPAQVAEELCVGCRQCYLDCPYLAIFMVSAPGANEAGVLARVNPARCARCGICVGSCPTGATSLEGWDAHSLARRAEEVAEREGVLSASCEYSALARLNPHLLLPCAGTLHPQAAERALADGAEEVRVGLCPEGGCPYREGNTWEALRLRGERQPRLKKEEARKKIRLLPRGWGESPGENQDSFRRSRTREASRSPENRSGLSE
jgi:Fe-S-cluster-containing hydrogenase component 2